MKKKNGKQKKNIRIIFSAHDAVKLFKHFLFFFIKNDIRAIYSNLNVTREDKLHYMCHTNNKKTIQEMY